MFSTVDMQGGAACAVDVVGGVSCWGPTSVDAPFGAFKQVAVGPDRACGVHTDGTLACWGGDAEDWFVGVPDYGTWTEVDVGKDFACARPDTDTLMICWGTAMDGQTPAPFGLYDDISVGEHHACAIDRFDGLSCWGRDNDGMASPPRG